MLKYLVFTKGIISIKIPFFDVRVKAGFPSLANDYIEERIDLNKELIKHPLSTFLVRSEGDSMVNAFIAHQSLLRIDRSIKPQNGDIVLAIGYYAP